MKLYFHPAACSLAPHILLRELDLPFTLSEVDRKDHSTSDGADYLSINTNGYVPALETRAGVLTEGPAITQHLAAMRPRTALVPGEEWALRQMQSALNFLTSELHKPMALLMNPDYAAVKEPLGALIAGRLATIEARLDGPYLLGDRMTLPDPYLFVIANWTQITGHQLGPRQTAFQLRMLERPAVQSALAAEGLVQRGEGPYFMPEAMLRKLTAA